MYELYEDAATLTVLGKPVFVYGLFVALGALLALFLLTALCKKRALPSGTALTTGALALLLGFVLSRVVYCLLDTNFSAVGSIKAALMLSGGGYAMTGALLGAVLAALISAKLLKTNAQQILDVLAPALLLFILFERLGEGFTTLGISRPLIYDTFKSTFLAQVDEYDAYLRTWMLEAAAALALSVVSLAIGKRERRAGETFLKTALLYGATQTLFESLRYDQHLKYGFVGAQHILSMLLACVIVIVFAVRVLKSGKNKALPICSLISLPVLSVLLVLIEFLIDRTSINRFLLYFLYVLLLATPIVLGFILSGKGEQNDQRASGTHQRVGA